MPDKILESDGPGSIITIGDKTWLFMSVVPFVGERKVKWFRFELLVEGKRIQVFTVKRNTIRVRYRYNKQPKPWLKELIK